jgi:antitoxin component of MazEF toxin-antitoxin module
MKTVTYKTKVIGEGNHASLSIPNIVLEKLGANRRAPLKITVNGHSYRSTATGVGGECRVVFPQREREQANAQDGDTVSVTLELELGYREVDLPAELKIALSKAKLLKKFDALTYSKRREFARQIDEAKAEETKARRIQKVIDSL